MFPSVSRHATGCFTPTDELCDSCTEVCSSWNIPTGYTFEGFTVWFKTHLSSGFDCRSEQGCRLGLSWLSYDGGALRRAEGIVAAVKVRAMREGERSCVFVEWILLVVCWGDSDIRKYCIARALWSHIVSITLCQRDIVWRLSLLTPWCLNWLTQLPCAMNSIFVVFDCLRVEGTIWPVLFNYDKWTPNTVKPA